MIKMLASTITSYPSHGQSIEVVLYGQERDGPTTACEGDLFFGYTSFPATRELLMHKIRITDF
jgi:hypothetical protein